MEPDNNVFSTVTSRALALSWRRPLSFDKNLLNMISRVTDSKSVLVDILTWRRKWPNHFIPWFGSCMGLLPNTYNCGLHMRRECRKRFPCHRVERKPTVSDHGMHHGMCMTHVPWWMPISLIRGGGKNVPGIPGAYATRNFTYMATDPCRNTTPHT